MSEVKISAEPRTEFGKGGARRTRRAGKVPAVLYGHGEQPQHISLPAREFAAAIRHGGINQVFSIEIAGGTQVLALPKAIQRDPIRDSFEHVDLLLIRRGEKVTVEVPVQLVGEPARDTLVMTEHDTISVTADAMRIPDRIEVSIEGRTAGAHVTAGQITMPPGAQLAVDSDLVVAVIAATPTVEQLEVGAGEEAAGVEAEAAGPAEAAPPTAESAE